MESTTYPVFSPVVLHWQLFHFNNLEEEHDPNFVKWVKDHGNLIVTHIGQSGPYMVINHTILLRLGDNGVIELLNERSIYTYVGWLGKWSWVNCCLTIWLRDFDKVAQWCCDRHWMYVLFVLLPFCLRR